METDLSKILLAVDDGATIPSNVNEQANKLLLMIDNDLDFEFNLSNDQEGILLNATHDCVVNVESKISSGYSSLGRVNWNPGTVVTKYKRQVASFGLVNSLFRKLVTPVQYHTSLNPSVPSVYSELIKPIAVVTQTINGSGTNKGQFEVLIDDVWVLRFLTLWIDETVSDTINFIWKWVPFSTVDGPLWHLAADVVPNEYFRIIPESSMKIKALCNLSLVYTPASSAWFPGFRSKFIESIVGVSDYNQYFYDPEIVNTFAQPVVSYFINKPSVSALTLTSGSLGAFHNTSTSDVPHAFSGPIITNSSPLSDEAAIIMF